LAERKKELERLERESLGSGFWQNPKEAAETIKKLNQLKEEIESFEGLKKELKEIEELASLSLQDQEIKEEAEKKIKNLKEKIAREELKVFLSGKYDKGNAILSIYAGAGGQDAQDWAAILLRMYQRYAELKGFKTKILHQSFGEGGGPEGRIGIKSAALEIKGIYAYGLLKKESGVHRLVRISPFSAQSLRHTSFALVEVLPEISKEGELQIEIDPKDLRIDFYRASGPGGQYVNRRETAVRITHLPTQITVSCQSERLQGQNKEKAMKMLYAKLYQLKEKEKEEELAKIKGKSVSIGWGSQIRSYVLHPYKMVKDLRTGIETSEVESVLDGRLDKFIEAEIKLR
jgi:peptide chain release factor 2